MDSFNFSEFSAVNEQRLLFGSCPQPTSLKPPEDFQSEFIAPVYNSIADWSAAELSSDSAPSPARGSPFSTKFSTFTFHDPGEDWMSWDEAQQSPRSEASFKLELLDSPNLSSIPAMSPSIEKPPGKLDDVIFGCEGVNDTRPMFTTAPLISAISGSIETQSPRAPSPTTRERRYPSRTNLKRKTSTCSTPASSPRSSCSPPPRQRRHTSTEDGPTKIGPKKTAHNMIEKRYRTNLNDKIAALRDSVPALRLMVQRLEGHEVAAADRIEDIKAEEGDDELAGLTPAHRLNKATILSKATEYLANLERKNGALVKENAALRDRVDGLEMWVMGQRGQRSMWD